jgi:dCTP deaminase
MKQGSVKPPGSQDYGWFIKDQGLAERLSPDKDGIFQLNARTTYVFKLRERLNHHDLGQGGFYGQATAKSSVGRVDVLARLIVSGMHSYEGFTPEGLSQGSGDMFLEITPITFNVKVKKGISLSQLRLFYGDPHEVEIKGRELFNAIFPTLAQSDGSLTVDLTNEIIGGLEVAAFRANRSTSESNPIPLWRLEKDKPDPCTHWRFVKSDNNRVAIQSEQFYILRSKQKICVPPGIAIYCRASDETIGEMRIHYAGFVHPLFGLRRTDGQSGTPLIFEVRGHQVNVTLADGEKMANLTFYRMSQDASTNQKPTDQKPTDQKPVEHPYENQTLALSSFFGNWPAKLRRTDEDGTVEAA